MAVLVVPAYNEEDASRRGAYERFLRAFADDAGAWTPLPREVSAWWRRRAASRLELVRGEWRVVGPAAAEGQVAFARQEAGTW